MQTYVLAKNTVDERDVERQARSVSVRAEKRLYPASTWIRWYGVKALEPPVVLNEPAALEMVPEDDRRESG